MRQGQEEYMLDRLLIAGIIEARGAERFSLIANALPEGPLKKFYQSISRSEERHYELFFDLAELYIDKQKIENRLPELLEAEAKIAAAQPIRAALH